MLITPSSQLVQSLADLQNSLPQPFLRDNYSEQPWRRTGPLKTAEFQIYAYIYLLLEKAMAPHSSALAWKIPWTEDPGRLWSMGSLGVGHN